MTTETYAKLKRKYLSLKAVLNVAGVNLTGIDEMKNNLKEVPDRKSGTSFRFIIGFPMLL